MDKVTRLLITATPTPASGSGTPAVSTHLGIPTEETIPLTAVRRTIVNNNHTYNVSIAEIIASLEVPRIPRLGPPDA